MVIRGRTRSAMRNAAKERGYSIGCFRISICVLSVLEEMYETTHIWYSISPTRNPGTLIGQVRCVGS